MTIACWGAEESWSWGRPIAPYQTGSQGYNVQMSMAFPLEDASVVIEFAATAVGVGIDYAMAPSSELLTALLVTPHH